MRGSSGIQCVGKVFGCMMAAVWPCCLWQAATLQRVPVQICQPRRRTQTQNSKLRLPSCRRYRQTELTSIDEASADAAAAADAAAGAAAGGGAADAAAGAAGGAAGKAADKAAGAAAGGTAAGLEDECHAERDADYGGETVVQWGDKNFKDSAAECCASCRAAAPKCNIWVWCGELQAGGPSGGGR